MSATDNAQLTKNRARRTANDVRLTAKAAGDLVVETGRTGVLAAIGAGDVAVDKVRSVLGTLRDRAEALPGEAQVQADNLVNGAAKEVRTRAEAARTRAVGAVGEARSRAEIAADRAQTAARPDAVLTTVTELKGTVVGLTDAVRAQATSTLTELAARGEEVVEDLRRQPGFRAVVGRAGRTVDAVEDAIEDILETGDAVVAKAADEVTSVAQKAKVKTGGAADEVTSAAQKTKASTSKAVDEAKDEVAADARATKRSVRATTEPTAPAGNAPAKRTTTKRTPATKSTSAARSGAGSASSSAPASSSKVPASSSSAPAS